MDMEVDGGAVAAGESDEQKEEAREAKNRYMRFYRSLRSSSPTISLLFSFSRGLGKAMLPNCLAMAI